MKKIAYLLLVWLIVSSCSTTEDNGFEGPAGEDPVELVLPDEFVAVEGDNLQLFHRSYIKAVNPFNYDIVVICPVGKNFPRYYEFKPDVSQVGNSYQAEFYIRRNDLSVIAQKTVTIRVIAKMAAPAVNKNVLVFGASATANGYFTNELSRRLTTATGDGTPLKPTGLNLKNITFVGRQRGYVRNIPLEATGGWSWVDYSGPGRPAYRFFVKNATHLKINEEYSINGVTLVVTETNVTNGTGNMRCTYTGENTVPASGTLTRKTGSGDFTVRYTSCQKETFNPFWNVDAGKLDFISYADMYSKGAIDVLIAHCGLNDIFAGRAGDDLINNYIKPFARAFHADFPDAKFIISTLPLLDYTGGVGASYGASQFNYMSCNTGIWQYADALTKMIRDSEFSDYVSQACVVQQFDNEYGYGYDKVDVNNRIPVSEHRGNNGAHPTEQGSFMVADAIYRAFNDLSL